MSGAGKQRPVSGHKLDPVAIVSRVCDLHGDRNFARATHEWMVESGVAAAVRSRERGRIYEYLMDAFNYQGVSDAVAAGYLERHGNASYSAVQRDLAAAGALTCPKLAAFEAFKGCGYTKSRNRCNNPSVLPQCPVPKHDLRKGALNQAAYSLALFIRDRANGDLVGLIDGILERADCPGHPDRIALMRRALMGELVQIYGVSLKVLNMTFASLLIGADPNRARWFETGASMIAIDTLVHNFLHRTGIHHVNGSGHAYGPACYGAGGCEAIIDGLARGIDARQFNPEFPAYFPRFIQHAIWRFCTEARVGICNGRKIDDRRRCRRRDCPIFPICGRVALWPLLRTAGPDTTQSTNMNA